VEPRGCDDERERRPRHARPARYPRAGRRVASSSSEASKAATTPVMSRGVSVPMFATRKAYVRISPLPRIVDVAAALHCVVQDLVRDAPGRRLHAEVMRSNRQRLDYMSDLT